MGCHTFVENVYSKNDFNLTILQGFYSLVPRTASLAMYSHRWYPMGIEKLSHILCMFNGHAKTQSAFSCEFLIMVEDQVCALQAGQVFFKVFHHILALGLPDLAIVCSVIGCVVVEGNEQPRSMACFRLIYKSHYHPEEENILVVHAIRRGCESQEKIGFEV